MIGEALIDLFFTIFRLVFSTFELVALPTQLISTLETILVYGIWIGVLGAVGVCVLLYKFLRKFY